MVLASVSDAALATPIQSRRVITVWQVLVVFQSNRGQQKEIVSKISKSFWKRGSYTRLFAGSCSGALMDASGNNREKL